MSKKSILLAVLMATAAAFVIVPHTARAATCTVTSPADSGANTLRALVADPTCDTITFDPGVPSITLSNWIAIDRSLTISGPVTISGGGVTGIFSVSGANVTLSGLTLTGGYGPYGGAMVKSGPGSLFITNSTFQGNRATREGGVIHIYGGVLSITNSTFQGNQADREGGGAIYNHGTLNITNSTFQGNQAAWYGGAIVNSGTLSVTSTLFSNNIGGLGGDDIYVPLGTANIGGSCINGNSGASDDVFENGGSASVEDNWWGTDLGPNQGVGTTNVIPAVFLKSAPVCGVVDMAPDDRINWRYGDGYVVFYPRQDDQARPVLHAYCISAEGQGSLELIVTQDMLDQYPEYPDKPPQNRELFHSDVCRVPFFFYILTTGEYQINVGPDWEGKVAVIIFTGMPPTNIYFYRYNILDSN